MPFAQLADAVRPRTTLVACSHVNWRTGEIAPAALADIGVPVILDGAQGAGAIPVDVVQARLRRLRRGRARSGCAAPTAPGCSTSSRSSASACARSRRPTSRFEDAVARLRVAAQGRRAPPRHAVARARGRRLQPRRARRAARAPTWPPCSRAGPALAAKLAERLAAPRPHGRAARPHDARRLGGRRPGGDARPPRRAGVIVRNLPGTPLVRASVGAWSSEDDLDRLLAAL